MKLSIALLLATLPLGQASVAAAQRLTPDPAFARLPGTPLRIADSLKIDLKGLKIEPPLYVFPGPKKGLILYAQWRSVWSFDSLGRRLWSKGYSWDDRDRTDRRDRPEVGEVTALGWDANGSMWVSDAAWGQVALLDQYGNVTKSIELPSWVRPSFSNRKTFPVFESMRVYARYPDGSMLVIPRNSMSITGVNNYDEDARYLLRINEDGIIQRTIVKYPSATFRRKDGDREFTFQNPLHQGGIRVSSDGMRTTLFTLDTTDTKMDTLVLRALNDRGDTVWTQKFGYPRLLYTETQMDSIARANWGNETDYRERRMKHLPRRAPAVIDFVQDVDKSVWLTLRGNGSTRPVVGFDAAGKPIGKFLLPHRRVVRAANMGQLWIGEFREQRGDLVRYRMK